jgi:hypothetical protein
MQLCLQMVLADGGSEHPSTMSKIDAAAGVSLQGRNHCDAATTASELVQS